MGAGISGLLSGWLLARAGHSVRIFEASKTVGGRIKTLRDGFSSGLYAEAGAMRIPENHFLTLHLARDILKLKTDDFYPYSPNSLLMINGQRITRSAYEANPNLLKYDLAPHERGLSANQLFDQALLGYVKSLPGFADFEMTQFLTEDTQVERSRQKDLLKHLEQHSIRTFFVS